MLLNKKLRSIINTILLIVIVNLLGCSNGMVKAIAIGCKKEKRVIERAIYDSKWTIPKKLDRYSLNTDLTNVEEVEDSMNEILSNQLQCYKYSLNSNSGRLRDKVMQVVQSASLMKIQIIKAIKEQKDQDEFYAKQRLERKNYLREKRIRDLKTKDERQNSILSLGHKGFYQFEKNSTQYKTTYAIMRDIKNGNTTAKSASNYVVLINDDKKAKVEL